MKRFTLLLLSFSLVLSLAAPAGAVFADGEVIVDSTVDGTTSVEINTEVASVQEEIVENFVATTELEPIVIEKNHGEVEPVEDDSVQEGSGQSTPSYPTLYMTELQVDGICSGATGCIEGKNIEFVEIYNPNAFDVSLDGWTLRRQATGENSQPTTYHQFVKVGIFSKEYAVVSTGLEQPGDKIIVNLPSSDLNNSAGSLFLVSPSGAVIDTIGWGSNAKSFYGAPAKSPPKNQSIQRCIDKMSGILKNSSPRNNAEELLIYGDIGPTPGDGIYCVEPPSINMCSGIIISEIGANSNEQFIEIHNSTDEAVVVGGCQLQTNRSTKTYVFADGEVVEPRGFLAIAVDESGLALTKTTQGTVYLLSSHGLHEVDSQSYSSLSQDTSWSLVDGVWYQTYATTPGTANIYKKYLPCEEGYWRNEETGRCNKEAGVVIATDCGEGRERNPATGRCRNIPTDKELAPCKDGQYRSEETNRCRSIATTAASVLKPCADDQFRNPATNRCKKIASTEELADCGEGRERNPETNRCRNVLSTAMPTAAFAPEAVTQTAQSMLGWWALGGVTLVALGYAGWQWRFEVSRALRRIGQVFSAGPKP